MLYAIEESPVQAGVIWSGSNDGLVQVTRDGGETWTDVTPPDMAPEGRIQTIDPSPHSAGKAYFAAYRTLLGDFTPLIYKTENFGESWTLLTTGDNGIPSDFPTRAIREDPVREGLLYAGTEFGMFVSLDDGESWEPFRFNMPVTPITDIKLHQGDLVLSTMGRAFWIMDDLAPLRQLGDAIASAGPHLFRPSDTYRRRGGGRGPRGGPTPDQPQYSQRGAVIDYMLTVTASSIQLEILDGAGEVVRTFESGGAGVRTETVQEMRGRFQRSSGQARLGNGLGVHRFVWDLTIPGASGSEGAGPTVVPDTYQARLTVDGQTQTRSFQLLMGPRVAADGVTQADLQAQFDLGLETIAAIEDASATIERLEGAMARVAEGSNVEDQLKEIEAALVTDRTISSYPQPMLADQLSYLYGNTQSADQKPAVDMYGRLEVLVTELERHKQRLERLMRTIADG